MTESNEIMQDEPVSHVKVVVTGVRFELDDKPMMNLEKVTIKGEVGYELYTTHKYASRAELMQVLNAAKNWLIEEGKANV